VSLFSHSHSHFHGLIFGPTLVNSFFARWSPSRISSGFDRGRVLSASKMHQGRAFRRFCVSRCESCCLRFRSRARPWRLRFSTHSRRSRSRSGFSFCFSLSCLLLCCRTLSRSGCRCHGSKQGLALGSTLPVLGFVPHAHFLVLDFQQFPPGPWFMLMVAGPVLILLL
jgi:hypothetical protein